MDFKTILFSEISFVPGHSITTPGGLGLTSPTNGIVKINNTNNNNNSQNHSSTNSITSNNNASNNNTNNSNSNNASEQFQAAKQQLCDPRIINLSWSHSEKVGGGLINVGNTCFLNSVLQCLTYCPPLYNYLIKYQGGHSKSCKINGFCMLCELEKHIKRTKFSNGNPIKPISIVQRLKYINKSFQYGRQEDAHELLRYIIDHMWKACLINLDIKGNSNKMDNKIKETTAINHIFGGYQRSQVLCLTCKMRSDTYDYFMDLMLDIRGAKSLEEALKKYTQAETLDNDNAYRCGRCKRQVTARKRLSVFKAPNVATFQFKRFDADRIFGGKITKFISYPEDLDLRPYMSDTLSQSPLKYQLNAVLVHIGHSSSSGHYYCFVKNSNGFWYRMDDSVVSIVNKNNVLQQQAYVLFYTRKASDIKQMPPTNGIKEQNLTQTSTNTATKMNNGNSAATTDAFALNLSNTSNCKSPQPQRPASNGLFNGNSKANGNSINSNGNHNTSGSSTSSNHHNHNHNGSTSSNNSSIASNIKPKNISIATWFGGKSQLEEDDQSKRKLNEITERDRFNEELDQGRRKKIRNSEMKVNKLHELAKTNPFQLN